ncbi:MAG: hypothetical protein KDA37_12945 [Planctomycetales bacterium]|nr:hypothetical protein [Planctomycetales bacterium]
MRIGIISDTHGLLRPEALDALAGVEHAVHVRDIGSGDDRPVAGGESTGHDNQTRATGN